MKPEAKIHDLEEQVHDLEELLRYQTNQAALWRENHRRQQREHEREAEMTGPVYDFTLAATITLLLLLTLRWVVSWV